MSSTEHRQLRAWPPGVCLEAEVPWAPTSEDCGEKLGAPKAVTAMAHKLARLVYRMLKFGQGYVDKGMEHYEAKYRLDQIKWLAKSAAALNLQLTPLTEVDD